MITKNLSFFVASLLISAMSLTALAEDLEFVKFSDFAVDSQLKGNGAKGKIVTVDGKKALQVELGTEGNYPGIAIYPPDGNWDLSKYDGVEIDVKNESGSQAGIALRVDNHGADGRNNCNTENAKLDPGGSCTLPVTFGTSWGNPGAKIDRSRIIALQIFSGKNARKKTLTISGVRAFTGKRKKVVKAGKVTVPDVKWVSVSSYPAKLDFEQVDKNMELTGGEFTSDESAIAGKCSLVGNSKGKGKKWFEFARTNPGYFKPGYKYTIKFKYRVLELGDKVKFYALLRSRGQGWGRWDRAWTDMKDLKVDPDAVKEGVVKVGLDVFKDYQLMFGINGDAKVIIDDIEIAQGKPYSEPDPETEKIKAIPAESVLQKTIDFESKPADVWFRNEDDMRTEGALFGTKSLFKDSMDASGPWNTAINIGGEVFPGGCKYHVYLKSKALAWGGGGSYAYIVVKRADIKEHKDIVWKRWRGPIGVVKDTYTAFEVPEGQSAKLELAIFKKGKAVFDDIVIKREPLKPKAITNQKPLERTDANLVWSEEFNGDKLDTSKWNVSQEPRTGGWWSKKNVAVKDGSLVLSFTKEKTHYAMGAVNTQGKFSFKYGYVEARMKLPKEQGHWPGIWLFAGSVKNVGNDGNDGTEVDIVECPWQTKDVVSHALHWDGYSLDHQSTGHHPEVPGVHEGWHTFAVDWSPAGYIFFVDGKETWRTDAGGVCDAPLHIILSDEKGGWSGNPDKAKNLPDHAYIDYVRVWQKK